MSPASVGRFVDEAKTLLERGWHTNFARGSVTRAAGGKAGLVENAVWDAMNFLQAHKAWIRTVPQTILLSGTWSDKA